MNQTAETPPPRLAVDIGGTFTDIVLEDGSARHTTKILTTPEAPEQAVIDGIARLLVQAGRQPAEVGLVLHGTTLATNALIERKGARTAFLTTAGFRDILEMGYEKRFAQYDLRARRPAPLVPRPLRFEAVERVAATGEVVTPLDATSVRRAAAAMAEAKVEAVAIGFLHAYTRADHEIAAAEILAEALPGVTICRSSEVCPEMREYERFSTTTANAYVRPLMAGYLGRLATRLRELGIAAPVFLMMSGGGLTTLEQATRLPIRLVESGPAGGAILAADIARAHGLDRVMAFDMGGTTAKICLIEDGTPDRARLFEIAREYRDMKGSGLPVRVPVIEMVEIGAGGGSIARIDAMARITVGPDSAGADPGPVAYGRGGREPTVTDANLCLGKIDAAAFAGGRMTLDQPAAEAALAHRIGAPLGLTEHWPAAGIAEIVDETMANAARVHAIERGKEPAEFTMIAFGGGAPLHAARLAEKLGLTRVIVPVNAGVGSAVGFLRAPISYQVVQSRRSTLAPEEAPAMAELLAAMAEEAEAVVRAGAGAAPMTLTASVDLRYRGQGHELPIPLTTLALSAEDMPNLRAAFEAQYQRIYGLTMPTAEIESVSWSVNATTDPDASPRIVPAEVTRPITPSGSRPAYDAARRGLVDHALIDRSNLVPGDRITGPAIIAEDETSTIVPSTFAARIAAGGAIVLDRRAGAENVP